MKKEIIESWALEILEDSCIDNAELIEGIKLEKSKSYGYKIKILFSNIFFLNDIKDLRSKFKIPKDGFRRKDSFLKWAFRMTKEGKLSDYCVSFKNCLTKNHISIRWHRFIESYFFFNKKIEKLIPSPISFDLSQGEDNVILEIYKDTTIKDIQKHWKEIEKLQNIIELDIENTKESTRKDFDIAVINGGKSREAIFIENKKSYGVKNIKKYKKMYEMKEMGKSLKNIAKTILGSESEWEKVSSYIKKYENIIKENILY